MAQITSNKNNKIKIVVYETYGSSEVLQIKEIDKPKPKDNQILIKVYAASTNPADWHLMRGEPFIARLANGIKRPKNIRLGADVSGCIEAVGKNIKQFKIGDEVFGCLPLNELGSFAEYVCTNAETFVLKPANITFIEAAAVPLAALTALQGLRDKGKIKSGKKVLINGASGGVGTFAVQIAKSYGCEVTGVCSTRNIEMVKSIGADEVIDYTKKDFTKEGREYDLVFDAVGNFTIRGMKRILSSEGIGAVAGFTKLSRLFKTMLFGPLASSFSKKKIGQMETMEPNKEDMIFLKKLLEQKKITPVIDKIYSLEDIAKAISYLEEGHARGKVVIRINS